MPTTNQLTQMLLSFEGRMRRRDYWLCFLGLCVVNWLIGMILGSLFAPPVIVANEYGGAMMMNWWAHLSAAFWIASLVVLWPSLAIAVKRCHDRGKSGLWLLLIFIPIIGFFWWLIDVGLLDGTPGPNKFGPSPKGMGDAAPTAPAPTAT